jgi:hypothetical protein
MSPPESTQGLATPAGAAEIDGTPTPPDAPSAASLAAFALGAGLLAALVSWGIGEAVVEHFRPKTHVVFGSGGPMTIASPEELMATQAKNATLAYAILGAVAGLALGLAGGLARSSLRHGIIAAIVGLALGAAAGGLVSWRAIPFYHRFQDAQEEKASMNITVPLFIHGAIWSAVGAAGGLAFGLGAGGGGRIARALVGGLIGAAIGAAVYELVGALAFPLDKTVEPISQGWPSRLLARSAVTILAAAGIALAFSAGDRAPRMKQDRPG